MNRVNAIHAIVTGRVQMVMFRDFVQRHARRYGLVGTVHNRADGSVEVVAQGEHAALQNLLKDLQKGSLLSRVDSVAVEWREPTESFDSFEIVY